MAIATTNESRLHPTPEPHEDHPHVVSVWLLLAVFAALMVLTVATVAIQKVPEIHQALGAAATTVALLVAAAKAVLVALIFMHLLWDKPFNTIVFIGSIFFVTLMIIILLFDSGRYYGPYVRLYEERNYRSPIQSPQ